MLILLVRLSTFLSLMNDDEQQQQQCRKRSLPHKVTSFITAIYGLFNDLAHTHGADVPKLTMSEALAKFRPHLQAFLNHKPWAQVDFYINQQGRPTSEVTQHGVKLERQQPHLQVSHLIQHFNSVGTDVFDIDLLTTASGTTKQLEHHDLQEQVATMAQSILSRTLGGHIGQVGRQVIPSTDPREIIVIDDSDDEDYDQMVWEDNGSVDWETFLE